MAKAKRQKARLVLRSVYLPLGVDEILQKRARKRGVSGGVIIRECLERALLPKEKRKS